MIPGVLQTDPMPSECPRCGDDVYWRRSHQPLLSLGTLEVYTFYVNCSKKESRSTRGLHGSCFWGVDVPGFSGQDNKVHCFFHSPETRWHKTPACLVEGDFSQRSIQPGQGKLGLLLNPVQVGALYRFLLPVDAEEGGAIKRLMREGGQEGYMLYAVMIEIVAALRAAMEPGGEPPHKKIEALGSNQG